MPLPSFRFQGRQVWVKIHPYDRIERIDPLYLTDPEKHVPVKDPDTGKFEAWGVVTRNEVKNNYEFDRLKMCNTPYFYNDIDSPEEQWFKFLARRKETRLRADQTVIRQRQSRDFVLKIEYDELKNGKGESLVWRTVKVSGAMKLSVFCDKVVLPVMGWTRNYHAYLFTDRRDGALFGPKNAAFADLCSMNMRGYEFLDDEKYSIAHVLTKEHSELGFHYDLGDFWPHNVTVEKILSSEESNGKVEILSGSGACPPEDCGLDWVENYDKLVQNPDDEDVQALCRAALNYSHLPDTVGGRPWKYDPNYFDLSEAKARLQEALSSRASDKSGPVTITRDPESRILGDELGRGSMNEGQCTIGRVGNMMFCSMKVRQDPFDAPEGSVTTVKTDSKTGLSRVENIKVGAELRGICGFCGKPDRGLQMCGRCRAIWYCDRECQKSHWVDHKVACIAPDTIDPGTFYSEESRLKIIR
ncbi:hypothetical protein BJ508DRAFT_376754 [Ascobolus immersus RN42]|uniref:MYND-type domain-containing protein n=1 Tax=Ascobolus immersus RN42 TaxID=1160509 RepID=A0A3N4I4M3_ASCIM|nr:hypothetical protein BJ508DRAFT_376754 [Ascobolus immersus RN42]